MAIVKCDRPMARQKMRSWIIDSEGWKCNHECNTCICAMKKNDDGTWEHINPKGATGYGKGGKWV